MMNSQLYIHSALYLVHLLLTYVSFVCGQNVINVFCSFNRQTFYYWEIPNRSPYYVIEGSVVESHPLNACERINPPPYPANTTLKWFVLIRSCHCSIDLKFKMAEDAGYDLVIAYPCLKSRQDDISSDLFDSNSTIEAIHVNYHDGEKIRNNFLFSTGCYVQIVPEEPFNIFRYIIPFVIAVGICMVLLMLFVLVKFIRERRRNQRNRLSSRHLKQLPVIKFKKGDHYDVCAICLEEYNEGNKLRVLPCSHAYHTKCIDPWLTNSQRTCPVCKQKIRLGDDSSDSESDSESEAPTETTPLLRSLARRVTLNRNQASNRNFLRNPVINSNQPDVIQDNNRSEGETSQTYHIRPTLEEQAAPFLQNIVNAEHPINESENSSAYSSSAPPFLASTALEHEAHNQPCTSSEQTSSLPNVTPSTSHVEVIAENPRKERKTPKDMVV